MCVYIHINIHVYIIRKKRKDVHLVYNILLCTIADFTLFLEMLFIHSRKRSIVRNRRTYICIREINCITLILYIKINR